MTSIEARIKTAYGITATDETAVFGVPYLHLRFENGDDMYVTGYGRACLEHLMPPNVAADKEWFRANTTVLEGTSTVFRLATKPVDGRSKDVVFKWNRMGEDIPDDHEVDELMTAEFNSPFEEFALLTELKRASRDADEKIFTQKPLAVYVPGAPVQLWRLGRRKYKMKWKLDSHRDIALDVNRQYAVMYEWVKGIDAARAYRDGRLELANVRDLTGSVDERLRRLGFKVSDRKPQHIIVRPHGRREFVRDRRGELLYAVVDYELLQHTPEDERTRISEKRHQYLVKQRDRFTVPADPLPGHLKRASLFGVDYVWGRTPCTGGELWVVGRDPDLFEYFLPERWETRPRTQLSTAHEIFHTRTKDDVNIVWKWSRAGTVPDVDPFREDGRRIQRYGYNSPFEEVSIAIELSRKGIRTVLPRAVYRSNTKVRMQASMVDRSRYETHRRFETPAHEPVFREEYRYVIIWGYWNGPDEKLAAYDGDYVTAVSALQAYREGLLSERRYFEIMNYKKNRLQRTGIEDLNLRGSHLLLSRNVDGSLLLDRDGLPDIRICNFELLRRVSVNGA